MEVRESLEKFIERVCFGKGSAVEIAVLPKVLEFYYKEKPAAPAPVQKEEDKPDKLLTASEVAELLGFTTATHCRPQAAVERLAREGKLHEPIRYGAKTLRWQRQWVDEYIKRISA